MGELVKLSKNTLENKFSAKDALQKKTFLFIDIVINCAMPIPTPEGGGGKGVATRLGARATSQRVG